MMIETRNERQRRVAEWCAAAFGAEHQASVTQRAVRFLEEAVELYQSAFDLEHHGEDAEEQMRAARRMAHSLIDYIFDREPGALTQELGGVGLTTLALAASAGVSADAAEVVELERVLSKPLSHFAQRNEAKNAAGFDVTGGAYPTDLFGEDGQ